MRLKTGDTVKVIAGKDLGKTGKILRTLPKDNKVVVEGINMVTKHQKSQGPKVQGGIIEFEAPIDASNVMYYDTSAKKASRIGYKMENGKKVRYAKATGNTIKK